MSSIIHVSTEAQFNAVTKDLRSAAARTPANPAKVVDALDRWCHALGVSADAATVDGLPFLRIWLRRNSLSTLVARELGADFLSSGWIGSGEQRARGVPVGVVGHWPAANVSIQPLLSMTCAILGGNAALVRVPSDTIAATETLLRALAAADTEAAVLPYVRLVAFAHDQRALQEAMARNVDGAMIWGGEEAVLAVRGLPFPHWTRFAVFGPRISIAVLDAGAWTDEQARRRWCQRLARDVWQFDQQACSSPQTLFLEKSGGASVDEFVHELKAAFMIEEKAHPRLRADASLASTVAKARAAWIFGADARSGVFSDGPAWTILIGDGVRIPDPVQGRTLTVLVADRLQEVADGLDGNMQTVGVGMMDAAKERDFADLAARRGVDRVVKLGRMHVFDSPWDGMDLVRPMVRSVRYMPSRTED
jgi:hypothetical protein